MTSSWLVYAIMSLILYGTWGFLGAKASALLDPRSVMWFSSIGIFIAGFCCLVSLHFKPQFSNYGVSVSVLTGLTNGLGTLCFIAALRIGPIIPIIMITALYPMVSILLAILFLHQIITTKQFIGILFSLVAIYCLA